MKHVYHYIFIFLAGTQCHSSQRVVVNPAGLSVIYASDGKGLFQFDLDTRSAKKLYGRRDDFFGPILFLNDSIATVGHQGRPRREEVTIEVDSPCYVSNTDSFKIVAGVEEHTFISETYYAINCNSRKSHKCRTIDYDHTDGVRLRVTTRNYDAVGSLLSETDSTYRCNTIVVGSGVHFCPVDTHTIVSQEILGKRAYSYRGDLYLRENSKDSLLLKSDRVYDPKMRNGYAEPDISPDAQRVVFIHRTPLSENTSIYEMNLLTREVRQLLYGPYRSPMYSPDGKMLLLAGRSESKTNKWEGAIYVFDLSNGKIMEVATGEAFTWKPFK